MSGNPSGSNNGGGGSSSGSSGGGSPCGACKFLRRKCVAGCIFAPYFDSEQGAAHFAAVHKVFGASNVSKLLLHVPANKRLEAVVTICYEAQARLRDPVHGCVSHIFALQQQVVNLQAELSYLKAHLAALELPTPLPPPPTLPQPLLIPSATLSMFDLPTAPPTYDLSSLFDPMVTMPSRQIDHHLLGATRAPPEISSSAGGGGGGDLQELARELLYRRGPPTVEASSLPNPSKDNL
ncbi:LOB domain-containing 30-like [Olea europaea subsp. europaea]|uniref:LOB domain-containing 30-like n=1 Tax=Olea europaea subsp. europaea TaxID=158383 RepID=A0A8S0QM26_OLEEU|nr:LOB domain-containing 30-like [Olea europaea subsp. europaea]